MGTSGWLQDASEKPTARQPYLMEVLSEFLERFC